MRTQKRTIFCSVAIGIISSILAFLMEIRIINNFLGFDCLNGHRNFAINCMLGISASAIVALLLSITSYRSEKNNVIGRYFSILPDIYLTNDYYVRWLHQFSCGNLFHLPTEQKKLFESNLEKLCWDFKNAVSIGNSFSTLIRYHNKPEAYIIFLKKRCALIYSQYRFNECCINVYWQAKIAYECWLRSNLVNQSGGDSALLSTQFEQEFKSLVLMLGSESELELTRKQFEQQINKYLHLKEVTAK